MEKGQIVLLNGTSSAGKTTLAKALQNRLNRIYYHICFDDFMHMTPRMVLHDDFDRQTAITHAIMMETAAAFSDRGLHVLIDDVLSTLPEGNFISEYYRRFTGYPTFLVRVNCPLHELERRERERGDRRIGQAAWTLAHMDGSIPYDLTVDTYDMSTSKCVDLVMSLLTSSAQGGAFEAGAHVLTGA